MRRVRVVFWILIATVAISRLGAASRWNTEMPAGASGISLNGISTCSVERAWAVGDSGLVVRRDPVGWHLVESLPISRRDFNLLAIATGPGNIIWIVGEKNGEPDKHRGLLLVSMDGGVSWIAKYPLARGKYPPATFSDVCLLPNDRAWIACGNGMILNTEDGGKSWRVFDVRSFSDHFRSIWAMDGDKAWACSDNSGGLVKTADGGANWQAYEPFSAEYNLPEIAPGQDYKLVTASLWAAAFDTAYVALSQGKIGKTADAGETWTVSSVAPQRVWFKDVWGKNRYAWAVGTSGEIYYSDTRGESWTREHGDADYHLNDVDMVDDLSGYGWAVGTNGTILRRVPRSYPDLCAGQNATPPYADIEWCIDPGSPVDSFQLLRTLENEHGGPSSHLASFASVDGVERYVHRDFHEYGGPYNYYYWIATFYSDGDSCLQGPLEVPAFGSSAPEFLPSPDNVSAQRTPDGVLLTWGPTGSHLYRVYRSEMISGPFYHIGETTQSYYVDTEVDEAATYFYLLRSVGAELTSPDSPLASVGPQGESYEVPVVIDPLGTYYDIANRTAYLSWHRVTDLLLGGYWVSLSHAEAERQLKNTSPLCREWYGVRYSSPLAASSQLRYGILPMDRANRVGSWWDFRLPVGICNTNREDATYGNNAAKLIGSGEVLDLVYSDMTDDKRIVYYTHSEDGGRFWSSPVALGEGVSPALAGNSDGLHAVWLDTESRRILHASKHADDWDVKQVFESQAYVSPPSFAVDEQDGHVTTVMHDSVCYGVFPLYHTGGPDWQKISVLGSAIPTPRSSIDLDENGRAHICFTGSDGEIYYWSEYTEPQCLNISNSPELSRSPCLDADGGHVRVVWEEQCGTDWSVRCWQLFDAPDTSLRHASCISECGPGNSSLQPTIRGNRVLWMREHDEPGGDVSFEIYGSKFRRDGSFTWEDGVNYSEMAWAPSKYPHLIVNGDKLYGVWTEGTSPHNWIRFEEEVTDDDDIVFHMLGGLLESAITTSRDGHIWFGDMALERVDYSTGALEYRIEGLYPDSSYTVGVGFYQEIEPDLRQVIYVDGEVLGAFEVPYAEPSYIEESVRRALTCDGIIDIRIENQDGGAAVASHISVSYDNAGGSGQQSVTSLERHRGEVTSIDAFPSPFGGSVTVRLTGIEKGRNSLVSVFDVAGRLVKRLTADNGVAEWHGEDMNGQVLPGGLYFLKLDVAGNSFCTKLIKLR